MKWLSKSLFGASCFDYSFILIDYFFILLAGNPFPLPYTNANDLKAHI